MKNPTRTKIQKRLLGTFFEYCRSILCFLLYFTNQKNSINTFKKNILVYCTVSSFNFLKRFQLYQQVHFSSFTQIHIHTQIQIRHLHTNIFHYLCKRINKKNIQNGYKILKRDVLQYIT